MLLICLALAILPAVFGGNICCIPKQWEGIEAQVIGIVKSGPPQVSETEIKVHYDEPNNRMAFDEKVMANGAVVNVKVIQLFDQKVEYVIQQSGTCTRKQLATAFPVGCIPDVAVVTGTHYEGSSNNKVNYKSYRITDTAKNVNIIVDMTSDTCEPIRQETYGQSGTEYYLISNRYYDITPGIANASVFDVPAACKNAVFTNGAPTQMKGSFFG